MRRVLRACLGDLPPSLAGLLTIIAMAMTMSTSRYVAVWHDEPTLWAHAVRLAPEKPRTINNYAVTLVMQGQFAAARTWFARAHQAGHSSRLPKWDHVEGEQTARANLKAIDALMAVGQP